MFGIQRTFMVTWAICLALFGLILIGCQSDTTSSPSSQLPALTALSVAAPSAGSLAKGTSAQLKASGTYADGSVRDVTALVTWDSSDLACVAVSNETKGLVRAVDRGTATITASFAQSGSTITGSTTLTVTDAPLVTLVVTPPNPSAPQGVHVQLAATGGFADGTTQDLTASAKWTSADPDVATVSDAPGNKGLAVAVREGHSVIYAQFGNFTASTTVTITSATLARVDIASRDPWIAKGMSEQFTAVGVFSDRTAIDVTTQVAWASSDPAMTIDAHTGLAKGVSVGYTTISATLMGVTGSRIYEVTAATATALEVSPKRVTIAKGTTAALQATVILSDHSFQDVTDYAAWSSSNGGVATVSTGAPARGVVKGEGAGITTITAQLGTLVATATVNVTPAALTQLNVVPANPSVPKGLQKRLAAIGTFSDGTTQDLSEDSAWGTSDPTVAIVSNVWPSRGVVSTVAEGTAVITASVQGKSAATSFAVTPATLAAISVTPTNPTMPAGTRAWFHATGIYSDGSAQSLDEQVTWSSSDPSVTVYDTLKWKGLVWAVSKGSSVVSASFQSVVGSTIVTVSDAAIESIEVTPITPSIAKGTIVTFRATGVYTDYTVQDLTDLATWSSGNSTVAYVSNGTFGHGWALGLTEGVATITATYAGSSGSATLTVTAADLVSIAVAPNDATIAKGTYQTFIATGLYTDGSHQDLSKIASWTSSDNSVAITLYGFPAYAYGMGEGKTTIAATYGGKTGTATLNVTGAQLVSLSIFPGDQELAKGTAMWLSARGTYTDGTTQDLTDAVAWTSSDTMKVVISNADGSHGVATGVSPGVVTITASTLGKSATTTLTVTAATLTSIAITPAAPSMAPLTTVTLHATGTFSDNSTQDIGGWVTWGSSDMNVAIVSNAVGSKGLVTAIRSGSTTITARTNGVTGSTPLTVE